MPKASFLAEENQPVEITLPTVVSPALTPSFVYLPASDISLDPVTNVRSGDESPKSIEEFAQRIFTEGLAQPILVRPNPTGGWRVIAGRRRLLAVQSLGGKIAAFVRDVDDDGARRLAFEENYRRKQFSPVDLARLFLEARGEKPPANWSERVSKQFGVSRATVTEHVKMIEGIADDPKLISKVHAGELALDAAILLAKTRGEERAAQLEAAKTIAQKEADRKAARARVDEKYNASKKRAGKTAKASVGAKEAPAPPEPPSEPAREPAQGKKPAKVTARHLKTAQADARKAEGHPVGRPLTHLELLEGLCSLQDVEGYPACMNNFLAFVCGDYKSGKGTQAELQNRWKMIASEMQGSPSRIEDILSGKAEPMKATKALAKKAAVKKAVKAPAKKPATKSVKKPVKKTGKR